MSKNTRRTLVALCIVIPAFFIIAGVVFSLVEDNSSQWSLTQVAEAAQEGRIEGIVETSNGGLQVHLDDGSIVYSRKGPGDTVAEQLSMLGVSSDELSVIEWETDSDTVWKSIVAVLVVSPVLIVFLVLARAMLRATVIKQPPTS
jgi:hypothetical protein